MSHPTEKKEAHTPGPWQLEYVIDGGFEIRSMVTGDSCVIAHRNPIPGRHEEFLANAQLIAAAPDLLDALKWARSVMVRHKSFCPAAEDRGQCDCGMFRVHDAIAKAEGR